MEVNMEMEDLRQPYCIDTPHGSITAYVTLDYAAQLNGSDEALEIFKRKVVDFQIANPDIVAVLVDDNGNIEESIMIEQQDLPDLPDTSIEESVTEPGSDETQSQEKPDSSAFKWTAGLTKLLIEQIRLSSGKLTKRKMFQDIAAKLNKEMNLNLTELQVSNRYKTLMRSYKQVVDNNKKSGAAKKSHAFEHELGELLKDNPNIRPVHTMSSSVPSTSADKSPSTPTSESSSRASSPSIPTSSGNATAPSTDSDPPQRKKGKKRPAPSFDLPSYLHEESSKQDERFKEFLSKMESMHKEKLEVFRDIFGQKK